jgi:hypothetical protein
MQVGRAQKVAGFNQYMCDIGALTVSVTRSATLPAVVNALYITKGLRNVP